MTLTRRGCAALFLAPLLLASACGSSADDATGTEGAAEARLQIVSTVAPITSIVANIAGDKAAISGVVPEGTNSHTFEPPPQVSALMEKADVVFVNGLQLEEPTFELAEENAPEDATIVKVGDEVLPESDYIYDFSFPKEDGKPNPHLWTDPTYGIKTAGPADNDGRQAGAPAPPPVMRGTCGPDPCCDRRSRTILSDLARQPATKHPPATGTRRTLTRDLGATLRESPGLVSSR